MIVSVVLTSAIMVFLLVNHNLNIQRAKEKADEKLYASKASIILNNFIDI